MPELGFDSTYVFVHLVRRFSSLSEGQGRFLDGGEEETTDDEEEDSEGEGEVMIDGGGGGGSRVEVFE